MPIAPAIAHAPTAEDAAMDDLEKYLALPVEDNLDLDVLSWLKARAHDKAADPASGRPAGLYVIAQCVAQDGDDSDQSKTIFAVSSTTASVDLSFCLGGDATGG